MNKTLTCLLFFTILFIIACEQGNQNVKLTDSDVIINSRYFSPDNSKILLDYQFWRGNNQDYELAILDVIDTNGIISENNLPNYGKFSTNDLTPIKWLSNKEFLMEIDASPIYRSGEQFEEFSFKQNDVDFKVIEKDKLNGQPQSIEHFSISPDKTKLLVAYRNGYSAANIELSVIKFNEELPVYGNVYTYYKGEICPILNSYWKDKDLLQITTEEPWSLHLTKQNRDFKIIKNSIDKPEKSGWYNSPLFSKKDSLIYFNKNTQIVNAKIILEHTWGDSFNKGLVNIEYEYKYGSKTLRSYFRTSKQENKLKIGDSLKVQVNKSQPLIHCLIEKYGR